MDNLYTENFRVIVDEAHVERHSDRWKKAVTDLRRVHNDLPDVAILAAQKLPASDPEMLASRLSNTAPREIAGIGKESLSDADLTLAVRRTHRSIAMQESATQIINERTSIGSASDFLSLKNAVNKTREKTAGNVAIETLRRQGIDVRRLMEGMETKELKAVSVGAYDRVTQDNRQKLAAALEIDTPQDLERVDAGIVVPSMRPARTQNATMRRAPSFGRKIEMNRAAVQATMAI